MRESPNEIPLADAAYRARLSWHQAYRLVLSGELRARRAGTRWVVDVADLERLLREREATGASPPAA